MVVTGGEMVVTGRETVVAPSGETVVAGGSSEEETGCRLVELDASSNIAYFMIIIIAIISMQCLSFSMQCSPLPETFLFLLNQRVAISFC